MQDLITYFTDVNDIYWGKSFFQFAFYISLVLIFLFARNKEAKISFFYYPVFFFIGIFNPLAYQLGKILFFGAWEYYTRLYSLAPILYCIAFGAVLLLDKFPKPVKLIGVGALCGFIAFQGQYVYREPWMQPAQNLAKVPTAVIRISEFMHEFDKGNVIKIVFPESLSAYARQYDATFVTPYGRIWGDPSFSGKLETADVDAVLAAAGNADCDYAVVRDWDMIREAWDKKGYDQIYNTNGYDVYDIRKNARTVRTLNEKRQIVTQRSVDGEGNTVLNPAGWAVIGYEYDDEGRKIQEYYLDMEGAPFTYPAGYAGIAWTYNIDGRTRSETYLDTELKPVSLGYATVLNEYENKRLSAQTYLDENGEPMIRTDTFYAGRRLLYNSDGIHVGERFEDLNGKLVISSSGYAGYDYILDDQNRLKRGIYLDTNGQPMLLGSGYAMFERSYDSVGNLISEAYLDVNGERTTITSGYAEVVRDYNEFRQVIYERYLDVSGQPVLMSDGYYGIRWEYNEAGLVAREWYVDKEGNEVLRRQGYSRIARTYDANNWLARESYYAFSVPFTMWDGCHAYSYEYDSKGNRIEDHFLDSEDRLCIRTLGYATIRREYNEKNQQIIEEYLDTEGNPIRLDSGYSKLTREYDVMGNMVKVSYTHDGQLQVCTSGYDTYIRMYNERKLIVEEAYLKDGKPVCRPDTMAGYTREYDDRNNVILESYFDTNHEPVLRDGGYAAVRREYNVLRQVTKEEYLGKDGAPVMLATGYAGLTRKPDSYGNTLEEVYLGTDGKPVIRNTGYARIVRTFNSRYQVLNEWYEDTEGNPVSSTSGFFGILREYDEAYRQIRETYLDAEQKPLMLGSGYAAFEREYDRKGNITKETYLDDQFRPVIKTSWIPASQITYQYNLRSQNIRERYDVPVGEGYAEVYREYTPAGDMTKEFLRALDGGMVQRSSGYAILRRDFDARRRLIREEYQMDDGQLKTDGYAVFTRTYDNWNNVIEERYLDAEENPINCGGEYASVKRKWDEHRWLIEESYYDREGQNIRSNAGFALLRREYDEVGNILSETTYDENGNLINRNEGYARVERTWDERRQMLSERFYDAEGKPAGISRVREYDGYTLVRETRYDAEGNEVE